MYAHCGQYLRLICLTDSNMTGIIRKPHILPIELISIVSKLLIACHQNTLPVTFSFIDYRLFFAGNVF